VLHKNKEQNLNIKAAYLHLMGDTLSSVAVIIGGVAIWLFNIVWIDPLITVLVGIYIIWHTWGVVKETIDILMQAVPANIDVDEIKQKVELLPEIGNIHHIHVWKLDDHQINLEAHINLTNNVNMLDMMQTKEKVEKLLHNDFGIGHITLQVGYNCCDGDNKLIAKKE
jgi:cobalt-zinc-cadmium efflux system protein